jgi:hypothetical protein
MWIFRELLRLIGRIAVAVLIAIVIAEIRALASGGDTFWTFRIVLMLLGALFLLLAGAGQGGAASERVNWTDIFSVQGYFPALAARPGDPRLTPTAVFVGSGFVLLALGVGL